jgi:hypothetical protein
MATTTECICAQCGEEKDDNTGYCPICERDEHEDEQERRNLTDAALSPVVGEVTFTVPNLDACTTEPQALTVLSDTLSKLSMYASCCANAMRFRLRGEIGKAQVMDRKMQRLYDELPKWARW